MTVQLMVYIILGMGTLNAGLKWFLGVLRNEGLIVSTILLAVRMVGTLMLAMVIPFVWGVTR